VAAGAAREVAALAAVSALTRDGVVLAAGAVAWRPAGDDGDPRPQTSSDGVAAAELEVALVHRPKYDDWTLPKGKLDDGEHVLAAAVREVREEIGHDIVLGRPLPLQRYTAKDRPKEVRYWAGAVDGRGSFAPNDEVDEVAWLRPDQAQDRLTHRRDVDVLAAFLADPVRTAPLILLRHGSAHPRKDWEADDALRPLAPAGMAQAEALAPLLACFRPTRVLSSDTRRCLDTLRPYAERERLAVVAEPLMSETGYHAQPGAAQARTLALLADGEPTVLCTHRPVLPVIAEVLCRQSGVPAPEVNLAPAAFWVLHVAGGRVRAVEGHGPELD
jgi:8-oxo-dGTP diphosphatase